MPKPSSRTPRYYDGIECTNRQVKDLLPKVLRKVHQHVKNNSALVLAAWPAIIGPQLASMTQAAAFNEGVLVVKVKNSTLYSLLIRHDKPKLLAKMKTQFPNLNLIDIVFRIT
jgi:hypothetical protein